MSWFSDFGRFIMLSLKKKKEKGGGDPEPNLPGSPVTCSFMILVFYNCLFYMNFITVINISKIIIFFSKCQTN